ncbi:MAG: MFS transporter [Lentisphaeria bacterium]|nr:MFS transporter [Lentisphaeria bacterium]NQZ69049.1 MFS transporter [Lentisphaeria bacterium]
MKKIHYNTIVNAAGEGFWGLVFGFILPATVLTILLEKHGASTMQIAYLSAVSLAAIPLASIFSPFLFSSTVNRKKKLLLWHYFTVIPCLAIMAVLIFNSDKVFFFVPLMLLIFTFDNFFVGMIVPQWQDWMAHIFPVEKRGFCLSIGFCCFQLMWLIASFLTAHLIDLFESKQQFGWLYLLATISGMISISFFFKLDDSDMEESPKVPFNEIIEDMKSSFANKNFLVFVAGKVCLIAGLCMLPFITLYYKSPEGGNLNDQTIIRVSCCMTLCGAAFGILMGRLGDRKGHRIGFIICSILLAATLSIPIFSSGILSSIACFSAFGLTIGSFYVSNYNLILETCPHKNRIAHITLNNLLFGVCAVIIPLSMGKIRDIHGFKTAMIASALVTLIATFISVVGMKEPRKLSTDL